MAGRKPVIDNRKKNAVTMNVTDEDLKLLDDYLHKNHEGSRAWFLYKLVYGYLEGDYIKSSYNITIPNDYDYEERNFCENILTNKEFMDEMLIIYNAINVMNEQEHHIIRDIISSDKKKKKLLAMIFDSKSLCEE